MDVLLIVILLVTINLILGASIDIRGNYEKRLEEYYLEDEYFDAELSNNYRCEKCIEELEDLS